jgi:hypothetical protein
MVVLFAFLAFAIDTGLMALTQTNMQNACDAAALAASQEITSVVNDAGEQGDATDVTSIVVGAAKVVAEDVAARNGVYIDPNVDVTFGKRAMNASSGEWEIDWGSSPYNVVKVTSRRDQQDTSEPDGRLPLAFGWSVGLPSVELTVSAAAFVEARDIAMVLDFSGSMNDDSTYDAFGTLGQSAVESNMADIANALGTDLGTLPMTPDWATIKGVEPANGSLPQIYVTFKRTSIYATSTKELSNVVLEFSNGVHQKFEPLSGYSGTFSGTGDNSGKVITRCWIKSGTNSSSDGPGYGEKFADNAAAVKQTYGLDAISYPYDSGSWDDFIDYCRNDSQVNSAGYRHKYGKLSFVNYLLTQKPKKSQTADLWKTPHYPFNAMKNGASLFCEFLGDLGFGDELGMVDYATSAVIETSLDDGDDYVDLGSDWITPNFDDIDTIQSHKQANHYSNTTNIGDGLKQARELLANHKRYGARPTILLMTDGQANEYDSFSMPDGFDWDDWTDYDGDGNADYSTSNNSKKYAFYQAITAINEGITIHTLSVGAGADTDLMQAIAHAGGGISITVPGGSTIADMEAEVELAFTQIAAKVPPPKLVYDE